MSVYKRPDSPYYHYDFQWRHSRFHGSTGETDRRKAEAFERTEKERVKRQAALRVEPAASTSFDIAADRYWMEVGQHSKETDLEVNIARLVEWIGANTPLAEIHDDLLAHLVARRRGEPRRANPKFGLVSAATVNRTVTQLLRRILTRARKKWRIPIPAEPDWAGHILKEPAERTRELRFDEEAAIETAERADYRPARLFAQATGLRRREVVSLTWSQVDWAAGIIRVIQKGDKPHVIPITPEVTDILWPLRGHHETHVFTFMAKRTRTCAKSGNRYERGTRYPISYQGWGTTFARTRRKAGVAADPRFASYGRDSHVAGVEESARCEGDAGPRRYQNDDALRSRPSRRRGRSDDGTCHRRSRTARRAREPHEVPRKSRAILRGGA